MGEGIKVGMMGNIPCIKNAIYMEISENVEQWTVARMNYYTSGDVLFIKMVNGKFDYILNEARLKLIKERWKLVVPVFWKEDHQIRYGGPYHEGAKRIAENFEHCAGISISLGRMVDFSKYYMMYRCYIHELMESEVEFGNSIIIMTDPFITMSDASRLRLITSEFTYCFPNPGPGVRKFVENFDRNVLEMPHGSFPHSALGYVDISSNKSLNRCTMGSLGIPEVEIDELVYTNPQGIYDIKSRKRRKHREIRRMVKKEFPIARTAMQLRHVMGVDDK